MMYLDTNVIGYAIEKHEKYGTSCKRILQDAIDGKIEVMCSTLVLSELISVLVKLNRIAGREVYDVAKSIRSVMALSIKWCDMNFLVIEKASDYKFRISGLDYVHIATMEINFIRKIITADGGFDKVDFIERIDPLDY